MARKFRAPKGLWDKVKDLDREFAEEIYTLSEDQLKNRLIGMAEEQTRLEKAKEQDTDLKAKQEQARVAAQTYTEPFKAIKLKRQLIFRVLEDRGKTITTS